MSEPLAIARTVLAGFDKHYRLFREVSAGARERFQRADWAACAEASRRRIDMYDQRVREAVDAVMAQFPDAATDESIWRQVKQRYVGLLVDHLQPECAETFYNSVACRVIHRQYYNNEYIFWRPAISTEHLDGAEPTYRTYHPRTADLRPTFKQLLSDLPVSLPFEDLARDVERLQDAVMKQLGPTWKPRPNFQVHVLRSVFYRNSLAYVVGRAVDGLVTQPFVIPFMRTPEGRLRVDAILLESRHIGTVFSLARSYFMVDMEVPAAVVAFLRSVLPSKPAAELYTLLGLQKQGKTLFYRDMQHHLRHSEDLFVAAEGVRGMVMVVFTLPSFPYVFKIIRDWFPPPKDVDANVVRERYQMVKRHDRAGRMADTLEFSHVAFPAHRIDPALRQDLERLAPSSFHVEGDQLIIRHLYIERRMVPLDIYLQRADATRAQAALLEFGQALRELSAANIFPGDLLLKNWGVTRYGRVVFYDYDEIAYLTDCRFRRLPTASNDDDETRAEPWFTVEAGDVFPEQFPTFLFADPDQRAYFMAHQGDLMDPAFWVHQQERIRRGEMDDVVPYPAALRFSPGAPVSP